MQLVSAICNRIDTDQSALDAFILGCLPRQLFLPGGKAQALKRVAQLGGYGFGMLMDFSGVVGEKVFQAAERDLPLRN